MIKKGIAEPTHDATSGRLTFPLSSAKLGDRLKITALTSHDATARLLGMGFIPGASLEVVSMSTPGVVVVALQHQRLGLGAEMAQCIQVAAIDEAINETANRENQPDASTGTLTEALIETPADISKDSEKESAALSSSRSIPVRLQNLAVGSTACVVGYEATARPYRRKLLAMGLTKGTEFTIVRRAPLGDPIEIRVRGFSLSLRKHEANALLVSVVKRDATGGNSFA